MDLSTEYMGLKLRNPLVVSSCQPLSDDLSRIQGLESAGAGAVVLYSMFEEQLAAERLELHQATTEHTESFAEALTYFPEVSEYTLGPEAYLNYIQKVKKAVKIPVLASLNGTSMGNWVEFSKKMEGAGADALELNIYQLPTDVDLPGKEIEKEHVEIVTTVKKNVKIPVAVKLSPFYTNMAFMAKRMSDAGADALVLFNRFYQPDLDLENLETKQGPDLGCRESMRLPLRWIALLYGRIPADLAATSGIMETEDAVKVLMAGAKIAMVCSALLKNGPGYLKELEKGLSAWLEEHEYESLDQMRGSMSRQKCEDPSAFERAQYIRIIHSYQPKS